MFFSDLRSWLNRHFAAAKRQRRTGNAKAMRRGLPLFLEALEDRTVPTVLFTPQFGFESLLPTPQGDFNYKTISDANVNLIFWGKFWGTAAGASQVTLLTNEAKGIIGSPYLGYLSQYGSNGFAQLQPLAFVDSSTNAPAGYSQAGDPVSVTTLQTEVNSALNSSNSHLRVPAGNATITTSPLYVVIVDPSFSDSNGGYNVPGTYTFSNGVNVPINMISVGTNFAKTSKGVLTTTIIPDFFSETLGHELAERMSDPTEDGYGANVSPGGLLPANVVGTNSKGKPQTRGQLADFEPVPPGQAHYGFRVGGQNGILMQPYWSNLDHAFVVADGNLQSLTLIPKWTVTNGTGTFSGKYSLTIKGDQFRNGFFDSIVINSTASGTQITLNGENFFFDAGAITDINVDARNGNDTIDVEATPVGVPVSIDTGAGDDDVIISRDAKLFTNVAGNVTAVGYNTDTDRLIINDQADTATNPSFKVTNATVQQLAVVIPNIGTLNSGLIRYNGIFRGGVIVNGGSGGNIFTVASTHAFPTTLNTGTGRDNVFVNGTTGNLTVNGQGGLDNVSVGFNASVAGIGGGLAVTNSGGYSAVTVDDSANKSSRTVILYNNGTDNVLSGFPTGGDIVLRRGQLSGLVIRAGSNVVNGAIVGGNTFRIHDTPTSSREGGVTTTINTGAGPDNVTIDGTTGTLALDVQDSAAGANFISVGSATANLDAINGPINITGRAGAESDLSIIDSASITSHQFVIDRNFVQRGGRARIGYQNMSQLTVRTAAQPDHIIVQDTAPFATGRSTWIPLSGGNDVIDVLRTTGTLLIDAGGTSAINVGGPTSSLDNIQGVVGLTPLGAGNHVALSLDDEAATTPQQLDVGTNFFGFAALQRSGAAVINVLSNSLYSFQWQSGSGGTTINEFVQPAQMTNYILGNDALNIGSKAKTISNLGPIFVTGGIGFDAVKLNDSGETRPQTYDISQNGGQEIFATRGTIVYVGPDIEQFEVLGAATSNAFNVAGTIAGMETLLHTGKGSNAVTTGGPGTSLEAIQGPVTLEGKGSSTLIVDDRANPLPAEYLIDNTTIRRAATTTEIVDFSIDYSGFDAVIVYGSSGGVTFGDFNIFQVAATPAGTSMTLYGGQSFSEFAVGYPMDAIKGPLSLHGQSGQDFAVFNDSTDAIGRKFTLTSNQLAATGIAPIGFDGLTEIVLYNGAGSDAINVRSVAPGVFVAVVAAADDSVVVGSKSSGQGGTVGNILGPVLVESTAGGPVSVTVDDSGDTVARQVSFTPDTSFEPNVVSEDIVGLAPATIILDLRSGAAATVQAGKGNDTFNVQATQVDTSLTLKMGAGDDLVNVGSADNSLDAILGPLVLNGQGGLDQLNFNDQGTPTVENYTLGTDKMTRADAQGIAEDMAPISFASFKSITLNASSGGSGVGVIGSQAGTQVTVNGNAGGQDKFAVDASSNAILGTVFFNGQADADFAQYYDSGNSAPHTYTLTAASVNRDGQAPVVFGGVFGMIVYTAMVGGNTINVSSVAPEGSFKIQAANGDHVTVGSLAPNLGGTLANILNQVNVVSYTPQDAVTVVFDDSGNTDTTGAKHIAFSGKDADGNTSMVGLTPIAVSWRLPSASSVTVRGGAANETFSLQPLVAETPLTIVGGTGINTLDYSAYDTDVTVNLQTGTATDLAGITDPETGRVTIQNVVGGNGNDTLTAGAARSILIGGGGADQLFGGSGEGILIGGVTDFAQPALDVAALDAVFQEWNRTDLGFEDRMSDLLTGSNSQGIAAKNVVAGTAVFLTSNTVHDDLFADSLTGGTGRDWFFSAAGDLLTNIKPGDAVT